MDEKNLLLTHMEDLVYQAGRTGMAHSKFVTASQRALVQQAYQNRRDILLQWDGGFEEAERQVAIFLQPDWGTFQREEILTALHIQFRKQDSLRHQDILGAVLGLGLSRDVVGDIALQEGGGLLVCLQSIAPYILQQLEKAGRVGIQVREMPLEQLPSLQVALREEQASVASLRLDAVLAAAFHVSRSQAEKALASGLVQLCHQECLHGTRLVQQGDILSLRGKGRVKLVEIQDLSRKGRQRIVLGYYG